MLFKLVLVNVNSNTCQQRCNYHIVKCILCPLSQVVDIIIISQISCRSQLQGFPDLPPTLIAAAPFLQLLPGISHIACAYTQLHQEPD